MKLNEQEAKPPFIGATEPIFDVHSIWPTIQGEGPFAGRAAVFVRLADCNLQCPLCDTDYTSTRVRMTIEAVLEQVQELSLKPRTRLVVITGGEPLRQLDLPSLCRAFVNADFLPQIETNGSLAWPADTRADLDQVEKKFAIVISPKSAKLHPKWLRYPDSDRITAFKYVLSADAVGDDGLPTTVLGKRVAPARPPVNYRGPIFLQPLDEQDPERNQVHLEAVLHSCRTFGYTLCLQLHKLVGLP